VNLLSGSSPPSEAIPPPRVAIVLDASASMAAVTREGPAHWTAARRGAERLLGTLPLDREPDLRLLAGAKGAGCQDLARAVSGAQAAVEAVTRATPAGKGALAATLTGLAQTASEGGELERVVVFTRLGEECGGDLCGAARQLVGRDVRLDLVVIGDGTPPACLAEIAQARAASVPAAWQPPAAIPFHVEAESLDPSLRLCGEAQAHPVPVPPGRGTVVVQLDPPLRVERRFEPGTRWRLDVIDFPQLDPPVREWEWRQLPAPVKERP
jgi:hypothetical protein